MKLESIKVGMKVKGANDNAYLAVYLRFKPT